MPLPIRNRFRHKYSGKASFGGLLLAFALILSYVETLIPFDFGIPGMKLGLANLPIVLVLYVMGPKEALLLNIMRVFLAGFLFGSFTMIWYSLAGALCSWGGMSILKKIKQFSITGVSMAGGVFHNMGQALIALLFIEPLGILYYVPALLLAGVIAGGLNGLLAAVVKPYLNRFFK